MRNGIIQFLLIFCAVSLLFFPQTSIDGAKMDYFYGLQRSLQHFFHFYFYLVLCNITKRSIFFPDCFSL